MRVDPDPTQPDTAAAAPSILLVTGEGLRGTRERALRRRLATIVSPVELRRYGVLRSGVLFRWCQRIATRRLAARIRGLARPDIVAHSFGAWLVGQALRQYPDLRVGRVVLIGSVLRPDFDWGELVAGGRVEAVLNQYGLRDRWVWATEYFIPDSGPSGRRGCTPHTGVVNYAHPTFGHTDFFNPPAIDDVLRTLWVPFFTWPTAELGRLANVAAPRAWSPPPWPLRATIPRLVVVAAAAAGAVGLVTLTRWLVEVLW